MDTNIRSEKARGRRSSLLRTGDDGRDILGEGVGAGLSVLFEVLAYTYVHMRKI